MSGVLLVQGDARRLPLRDGSVSCVCTSPPYWNLRDYNVPNQIGLEPLHDCLAWARQEPPCAAPQCWVCAMRVVFREVWRVLVPTGVMFVNVGDSYARSGAAPPRRDHSQGQGLGTYGRQGYSAASAMPARGPQTLPEKNLMGLPWRMALALQSDGWILRSEIIWAKKNCMPESVQDRPTRAHEQVFLFSKQGRYYYDGEAVRESYTGHRDYTQPLHHPGNKHAVPLTQHFDGHAWNMNHGGRAMRSVLSLASEPCHFAHFATMPTELVRRCLLAGAPAQVCSVCGKPHVRQVERGAVMKDRQSGQPWLAQTEGIVLGRTTAPNNGLARSYTLGGHTTGFSPSCTCAAPTRSSLILDPFAGSGTVGLVARELGHDAVCLDLSMAYLRDIARERLGLAALQRWEHGATTRAECYEDLPLFGG